MVGLLHVIGIFITISKYMSLGAAIYSYRNNFQCEKQPVKTKSKSKKIKLINLIIDGFNFLSKEGDDLFVSIAQLLMKKGYPVELFINKQNFDFTNYFMKALFSVCPFNYESLYINKDKFNLFKFREQFDLFNEIKLEGLNYYRNRACIPIKEFSSFDSIKKMLFTNYDEYNKVTNKLSYPPNEYHTKAKTIFSKNIIVHKDYFTYQIIYGYEEDFKNGAGSSWDISILSRRDENYIDFCLRLHANYDKILNGDKSILQQSIWKWNNNELI